jgi:uncharacterized protein (TIGR00730 family)
MPFQDSSQQPRSEFSQPPPQVAEKIKELIDAMGADPTSPEADLIEQVIYTSLRMLNEDFDMGQLKLMTRSFKEMRHAYRVFNSHRVGRIVSIFGSARTPPSHPAYQIAKAFSAAMTAKEWVCMTGAADGIMRAGLEGAPKESSFGLSIRLPFENSNHTLLAGDPKLINFRYFFTRKLMFLSHSDAIAAFPGGVGTQDELFEALTLMQTGRSNIVPLVLLEGVHERYWQAWEHYIQNNLLANGYISAEDQNLYYRAPGVQEAVDHIIQFYRRYHSSRYVKDILIIRILTPLTSHQIAFLNDEFRPLIQQGEIYATSPLPEEDDHLDLPRIAFVHNHKHFGLLRAMIDHINAF